jgi:D-sedoheptulose 7-phosphate isomerase
MVEMSSPAALAHLDYLVERLPVLAACREDVLKAFEIFVETFRNGGKALICGNGGSAADAEHWAGELLKGFEMTRPLSPESKQALPPELAESLQEAVPVIPLTGFTSLHSAFGNDVSAQYSLAQLTWALGTPGDCLVGLTTSGNSDNVLWAFKAAKAKGMTCIGLTGKTGGRAADLCDVCITVPESRTCLVQELHLPVYHTLCLMIESELFGL